MTQSAPSRTALPTSETSARVGRGLYVMLSNICVAQITGLPARLHLVTTGDHDTVSDLENLVEVVNTLLVLDLGNDLDVLALLAEDLTDGQDVLLATNEGGEDHVHVVLDTEAQVGPVLLGQRRQVDVGLGEVDTLLAADLAVVDGTALQGLLVGHLEHLEGEDAVVDVDGPARSNDLGDVLVVDVHVLVVTGGGILVVSGDVDLAASRDGDVLVAGGVARADLRALGVEGDSDWTAGLRLLGLARVVDDGLVVLVAAVGEVHADDVQAGGAQHVDLLRRVGLGTCEALAPTGPHVHCGRCRRVSCIPMVQMMLVRRKFLGGVYSVLRLDSHSTRVRPYSWWLSSTPYPVRLGFHTELRNWLVMEQVTVSVSRSQSGEKTAPAPPTSTKPAALGCDTPPAQLYR
ncbi:Pyruvate [Hortaea werneckii]|nr:Pyruvate [Hortaea werneckii]